MINTVAILALVLIGVGVDRLEEVLWDHHETLNLNTS
jgi:hypothetical protein